MCCCKCLIQSDSDLCISITSPSSTSKWHGLRGSDLFQAGAETRGARPGPGARGGRAARDARHAERCVQLGPLDRGVRLEFPEQRDSRRVGPVHPLGVENEEEGRRSACRDQKELLFAEKCCPQSRELPYLNASVGRLSSSEKAKQSHRSQTPSMME